MIILSPSFFPCFRSGGGGIVSTARDFTRFATMLANGGVFQDKRILSESSVAMMLSNQLPQELLPFYMNGIPFFGSGYGYGIAMMMNDGGTYSPKGEASWGGE